MVFKGAVSKKAGGKSVVFLNAFNIKRFFERSELYGIFSNEVRFKGGVTLPFREGVSAADG